jgi:hypothetical protein
MRVGPGNLQSHEFLTKEKHHDRVVAGVSTGHRQATNLGRPKENITRQARSSVREPRRLQTQGLQGMLDQVRIIKTIHGLQKYESRKIKKYMKAHYMKQRVIKDVTMNLDEIEQLTGFSSPAWPQDYKAEMAQLAITLESVEIPDHLVEKFKETFKNKKVLQEKEVMDFLESNK